MNHNMLYLREFLFDRVMHPFRDEMALCKGLLAVRADLDIDINLISKDAGVQDIHPENAFLAVCASPERLLCLPVAGYRRQP